MNVKEELQKQNNRLDKCRRKLGAAEQRRDAEMQAKFTTEIEAIVKNIESLKAQKGRDVDGKSSKIKALAFNRELSKAEQADMGKLKKSVKGLVVVHPMTALGREMDIKIVTGFAPQEF